MLFEGGFKFSKFLTDALAVFVLVIGFWFVITFSSRDISRWPKALELIALISAACIGGIIYLITQARVIAERNAQHVQAARDELRHKVGFTVADVLGKLDQLGKAGTITQGGSCVFA